MRGEKKKSRTNSPYNPPHSDTDARTGRDRGRIRSESIRKVEWRCRYASPPMGGNCKAPRSHNVRFRAWKLFIEMANLNPPTGELIEIHQWLEICRTECNLVLEAQTHIEQFGLRDEASYLGKHLRGIREERRVEKKIWEERLKQAEGFPL